MLQSPATAPLSIRPAAAEDVELFWAWANDLTVRCCSFNREPIPYDSHVTWFQQRLSAPGIRMWVLELDQVPVGQIRYERKQPGVAEIGFSVDNRYRGRGLGTKILELTAERAFAELGVNRIIGVVLLSNPASRRAFIKAGFVPVSPKRIAGQVCDIFALWRDGMQEMGNYIEINGRQIGPGYPAYIIAEMSANHHHEF
jgi:UDP-2,4-diacetamido-2,4,6-trideoxy-beta-L-altropyranose hydrolase